MGQTLSRAGPQAYIQAHIHAVFGENNGTYGGYGTKKAPSWTPEGWKGGLMISLNKCAGGDRACKQLCAMLPIVAVSPSQRAVPAEESRSEANQNHACVGLQDQVSWLDLRGNGLTDEGVSCAISGI